MKIRELVQFSLASSSVHPCSIHGRRKAVLCCGVVVRVSVYAAFGRLLCMSMLCFVLELCAISVVSVVTCRTVRTTGKTCDTVLLD